VQKDANFEEVTAQRCRRRASLLNHVRSTAPSLARRVGIGLACLVHLARKESPVPNFLHHSSIDRFPDRPTSFPVEGFRTEQNANFAILEAVEYTKP
jgi:hypothetical protein